MLTFFVVVVRGSGRVNLTSGTWGTGLNSRSTSVSELVPFHGPSILPSVQLKKEAAGSVFGRTLLTSLCEQPSRPMISSATRSLITWPSAAQRTPRNTRWRTVPVKMVFCAGGFYLPPRNLEMVVGRVGWTCRQGGSLDSRSFCLFLFDFLFVFFFSLCGELSKHHDAWLVTWQPVPLTLSRAVWKVNGWNRKKRFGFVPGNVSSWGDFIRRIGD